MPRPHVILNAAMTLDGKIATVAGDSDISCPEDLNRLHRLRASVDAVMVGVGTVLSDDPSLTVRRARGKNPIRVIVDGSARTPPQARALDGASRTIIATARSAPEGGVRRLSAAGAEVVRVGEKEVDLPKLLGKLYALGVRRLLLEGGSTLNWAMLSLGLVDELQVAISPRIVGGAEAKTLVGGGGFAEVSEGIGLGLSKVSRVGGDLLLTYRTKRGQKC